MCAAHRRHVHRQAALPLSDGDQGPIADISIFFGRKVAKEALQIQGLRPKGEQVSIADLIRTSVKLYLEDLHKAYGKETNKDKCATEK